MRHSGTDLVVTARAPVELRRRRQVPHPPAPVPPALHRVDAAPHPRQVQRRHLAGPAASGAVATRTHAPTLRTPAHPRRPARARFPGPPVPGAQTYPNGLGLLGSSAMATITAYGEWISPISAQALTANVRRLSSPTVVGDEIWWSEDRPAEGGRLTVMARRGDGALVELLPAPWNARSRVHEYGGRSYLPVPGPDSPGLVFVHFPDQRLYRLDPGAQAPVPLTPVPTEDTAPRYADLVLTGSEVLCVRERHHRDGLDRHVVAVPLDGSAADDPAAVREVVGGSHFLANPRLSPDGRRLAWLAWDHPRM